MMKSRIAFIFISAAVLVTVSACSYVQSLFPDKEKDYQYTTEIPPLNIPADLGSTSAVNDLAPAIPKAAVASDNSSDVVSAAASVDEQPGAAAISETEAASVNAGTPVTADTETEASAATVAPAISASPDMLPANAPTVKQELIQVELVNSVEGASQLHLGVPFDKAWRIVGKALSRKSIEVTQRNKEEGLFNIRYDHDEKKLEDGSFWNEVVFIFSGFQGDEKAYLLKLVEKNQQTDVIVLDEDQKPLSDTSSLNLLTLLQKTIETDLADK